MTLEAVRWTALVLAAVPQTLFVLYYGLPCLGGGAWWRDRVGRALFVKAASLAVLLDLFALWLLLPGYWFEVAATICYFGILAACTYQFVALIRERRESRRLRGARRM